VRGIICSEETDVFMDMKVPRQCPLVLVKVAWRRGKRFGYEEGTDQRWSRERS
jgi:hypothetical protein